MSALAAAILASTLTGRTVAIPPLRQRSYSESDCSYSENRSTVDPYATTAELTGNRWNESMDGRPRLPSPTHTDEDYEEEEENAENEVHSDSDEGHVYHSIEMEDKSPIQDAVYAVPLKKKAPPTSERSSTTDCSAVGVLSAGFLSEPQPTEENITVQERAVQKVTMPKMEQAHRTTPSPDLTDDLSVETPRTGPNSPKKQTLLKKNLMKDNRSELVEEAYREALELHKERLREVKAQTQALAAEKQALARQCQEQGEGLQAAQLALEQLKQQNRKLRAAREKSPRQEVAELLSLRQQAQELVDENDGLKVTVHRLNVELSRYQAKFRPLSKAECPKINALPMKGPPPPWLLDMKYLSPLLLAYEDRLSEKDELLRVCEEELKTFSTRVGEVVRENEELHQQLERSGPVGRREWHQLQDQAKLVLEENQVLMEQLDIQQAKAKETHNLHINEVSRLTKELMLLESEKQRLQEELSKSDKQLQALQAQHREARSNLDTAVSWEEHSIAINKLKKQLQQEEEKKKAEIEELMGPIASLQAEKKTLLLENKSLSAEKKTLEAELEISQKSNRKAQKKIRLLKQQVEEAMDRELAANQYLASIISLAERTTQERDQLMHMASTLEQDKNGVLNRIIEGTVRLGKMQEKVRVYKKKAAARLGVMGHRLQEQEDDFAGKADSYQREIRHLQRLLRDRQEVLDQALQQKRDVESELELVWESACRENRRMKEALLGCWSRRTPASTGPGLQALGFRSPRGPRTAPEPQPGNTSSPPLTATQGGGKSGLQQSPMFESDSDPQQGPSSDESEQNGLDFYS
ncbi:centrosomal protein of 89 kDa isoform X2 [Lepisosteus oculatus]|uniref:centrosomal protein of 89 kDa isoform X2 n=1 Tax=Lepisosteus oculatus TaxID=7918 RepID=UPI0035F4FF3E